ncbi:TBC1 domain family member 15-like isoform X2 [Macrosteles quadrilineatus]|uniref:TBC1 domain family member 15-like isoform X2 n=1 Tax=Macrosteles quadrilineatus TaxID=74068 RepID=UPI0023E3494E|nr:TBC1 domain family member 15-like isoform X2 [Macrosteles quadrilineatus]
MDDFNEQGTEIFSHHGVILRSVNAKEGDDGFCNGTLSIVQYSFGKCIEWKPIEVSEVSDCPEQDWSLVTTVGQRARTFSTNSGPSVSRIIRNPFHHRRHRSRRHHHKRFYQFDNHIGSYDGQTRLKPVRIEIRELKAYQVKKHGRYLVLMQADGSSLNAFHFQYGNADCFVSAMRAIVRTRRSARDRNLYIVLAERNEAESLNHSFAELNLFSEAPTDVVWKFMSNLKHRPYETTMETFSKLTDVFLYKHPEQRPEDEVVDLLNRSLSSGEMLSGVVEGEEDYQMIPSLPPRPTITRGPPLTAEQWAQAKDEEGVITDPDWVKDKVFRGGISPSLRHDVWKYLLGYYPWHATTAELRELRKQKVEEYFRMKLQWRSMSMGQEERFSDYRDRKSLIEKDVNRTDRTHPFFEGENNSNLALLYDILMTYVMYNFDLGYVQGMSDLLSPILILLSNEVDAFWCFVGLMDRVYRNFDMDQAGMKKQLSQLHSLLGAAEPELAGYLDRHDSGNMFFCFRWLLVLFKREFTYDDILVLWETIFTDLPCPNFHLLLCVAILDCEKDILIENKYQFNEILKHVNDLSMKIDLEEIVCRAESIYHQLAATKELPRNVKRTIGLAPPSSSGDSTEDEAELSEHDCETVHIQDTTECT